MDNSYGTSYGVQSLLLPLKSFERITRSATLRVVLGSEISGDIKLSRLISLLMTVLLLTFGAVYKLTDSNGVNSSFPELALALVSLLVLGGSYFSELVRRRLSRIVKVLCYATSAWFIALAAANNFAPNYAVGLLFIIPGLGVAFSLGLRNLLPLGTFFTLNAGSAAVICYLVAGTSITPIFFIASLICISLVTVFVAGSRLHAQNRFHASEEAYRAVIQQASDGIYMLDAKTLRFLDANPAFCGMVGMTMEELRRMSVGELIVATSPESSDPSGHHLAGRHADISERMLRRADGSVLFVDLHVDRIISGDREILSVVVHDISSRKEYEQRLVRAKESAEEIARFKSSLLANMSHEIRTPLCSILGWTSVLRDELPEQHRELVRMIEQSGKRLHSTLDSVLELAQLHANTKRLHPVIVDVNDEVRRTVDYMAPAAERKGLRLHSELSSSILWAETDIACLRRVLGHLVENAIKFTDKGEIAISVSHSAKEVSIAVLDTGVGIDKDFLPFVFDEFKQESAGLSRDHEGNGLGLAIARRLVEMMNGRIHVESHRGIGSKFTIHIPMNASTRRRSLVA